MFCTFIIIKTVFELTVLLKSVLCATFKTCFKSLTYQIKTYFFEKIVLCTPGVRYGAYLLVNIITICLYHRLNGSSSPVLTATSLSNGESKNSTPHRIKTPDSIEIKFGTVDYVGEGTRHAKFYANSSKRGFSANGWNIRKNFYLYIRFFLPPTHRSDPLRDF